jgi:hypothetical protein
MNLKKKEKWVQINSLTFSLKEIEKKSKLNHKLEDGGIKIRAERN